jgi:tetratricopeptide (TPR) repeat protein
MLKHKTEVKERDIDPSPRNIEVYFLDNDGSIHLELPSAQEIALLRDNYKPKFSVSSLSERDGLNLRGAFKAELDDLLTKYDRYKDSPNYLVRIANLSELVGDNRLAEEYMRSAYEKDSDTYKKHQIGNSLVHQNRLGDAEDYFYQIDDDLSPYVKLRLAFFAAVNQKVDQSMAFLEDALELEPDNYDANLFLQCSLSLEWRL